MKGEKMSNLHCIAATFVTVLVMLAAMTNVALAEHRPNPKPPTEGQLSEMVGRIGYIAMEYGFSLDVWGSAKLAEEK